MTPERPDPADWQLERYLLDELPADDARSLRESIERSGAVAERLAALERSNREILEEHSPAVLAAAIRARLGRDSVTVGTGRAPRPWMLRPALLAFLGLAVAGAVMLTAGRRGERGEEIRIKGLSPSLLLYRQQASGPPELLGPGSTARERETVQLVYQAAGRRYGVVVSLDGRGQVTLHLPVAGRQAAPLEGGPVPLAEAYQLDDAPHFERFYLVTADEPFAVEVVLAAVRGQGAPGEPDRARRLDLPASFDQYAVSLRKEPPS